MSVKELQERLMVMLNNKEITLETEIGMFISISTSTSYADYVYTLKYDHNEGCLYLENRER